MGADQYHNVCNLIHLQSIEEAKRLDRRIDVSIPYYLHVLEEPSTKNVFEIEFEIGIFEGWE